MFEVNGVYANRKGEYTVLQLTPPFMRVRYMDGTQADLKISVQERIWANISVEYEARAASKTMLRRKSAKGTRHYIKAITLPSVEELAFSGWAERRIIEPIHNEQVIVDAGDRLILYALECRTFFAVVTITGTSKQANPKDYFFNVAVEKAQFFPIDIDAAVAKPVNGTDVNSIDLESQTQFRHLSLVPEQFLPINEDDFELLAEAIAELTEDEDVDDADIDEDFDIEEDE